MTRHIPYYCMTNATYKKENETLFFLVKEIYCQARILYVSYDKTKYADDIVIFQKNLIREF